jgi:hypothetical protein
MSDLDVSDDAFIMVDGGIVKHSEIRFIDMSRIEDQQVVVFTQWNGKHKVTGNAALYLVWQLAPSALEGKRLRWPKHAWAFHNIVGHPLMQVLSWCGYYKLAMKVHDRTIPKPKA